MSEATPIEAPAAGSPVEVQEPADLGDAGQKAIKAERDARKAAERSNAELAARLKEFEDAKLTELERANNAAAEAAAELARLRAENVRATVALSKGVPADLIEFLTGETEEEVAAKADLLLSRLNAPGTPKPDPSQGAKGKPLSGSAGEQFAAFFESNLQ